MGRFVRAVGVLCVALLVSVPVGAAGTGDGEGDAGDRPTLIPRTAEPLGLPYADWAGEWWRWLLGFTNETLPAATGDCETGQSGEVFFIPNFGPNQLEIDCLVPAGRHVLVAGATTAWDAKIEGCESDEALHACVASDFEADPPIFSDVSITIDGEPVTDLDAFRVISPPLDIDLIEDNIVGGRPGTTVRQMAGGWFVMLEPLPVGSHTIISRAIVDWPMTDGPVATEMIANLTVVASPD